MTKKAAPTMAPNQAEPYTLRFKKIRGGTVAFSCDFHWMKMKAIAKSPLRTSRAMMRALPQLYLLPPHCRARSRQMMQGKKTAVPMTSNLRNRSRHESVSLGPRLGTLKKGIMKAAVTAPKGRLM